MAPQDHLGPSTNKSSLLWAYHLRQENIHLVNRIDCIGLDVVTANKTTLAVQQSCSNLETRVEGLERENPKLRDEIRSLKEELSKTIELVSQIRAKKDDEMAELRASIESLNLRVKAIEDDDAELRAGLSNVENKCELIVQKYIRELREPLEKVARETHYLKGDAGRELSQEHADTRCNQQYDNAAGLARPSCINTALSEDNMYCENPEMNVSRPQDNRDESITMIPDSMPSQGSILPSPRPLSTQPVIGSQNVDTRTKSPVPSKPLSQNLTENQNPSLGRDLKCLKQNEKSLAEYFLMAERIRSQLPRRKQEGVMVEAFYEGLRDGNIKLSLERSLEGAGWTWSTLEMFCRQSFARNELIIRKMQDAVTEVVQFPEHGKRKSKKRKRRHVSKRPLGEDKDN